ncbi:hypothetical protein J5N97_016960 [Dioscorea zingiberensis]|uniref:RRM domain-containing protein n=1 Tax=Dioscorea zingiberensis TaxID=325984 RepID=A0A9D5CMY2_9LILI|nr:hypothetical protein J5N97_016960 [Dioscorea zingiberensis]
MEDGIIVPSKKGFVQMELEEAAVPAIEGLKLIILLQGKFFGINMEELKNLRSQLYSAAEHFEQSYTNDKHKKIVLNMLKVYVVKALVNSVDHLGCVAYKLHTYIKEYKEMQRISKEEYLVSLKRKSSGFAKGVSKYRGVASSNICYCILEKIKSLGINHQMLIKALRTSTKLIVSDDGKKVRCRRLFTESDKEELQSCTDIVENLPEDYTRQSLEKMFSNVGSVKNVRICNPQDPNTARSSKSDMLISNKVEKLNDERNLRKGLHVRAMLRHTVINPFFTFHYIFFPND